MTTRSFEFWWLNNPISPLEVRFKRSNGKVNTKLRKTLEAQFILQMTFWLTATSCELIGNSIREVLETENVNISKMLGYYPWKEQQVAVLVSIVLHWAPLIKDSPSPARSVPSIFILLRTWLHHKKAKQSHFKLKSNEVKSGGGHLLERGWKYWQWNAKICKTVYQICVLPPMFNQPETWYRGVFESSVCWWWRSYLKS